jgi:quercetin dioxygenase-like cupin family protein
MKPIAGNQRLVANIRAAAFHPFLVDGKPLPLQSVLQLDTSHSPGVGFHIYRMEPGARSQPHEHTCDEQFLVLDGEVIDNDGYVYRAGDLVLLKAGTQHSSHTLTGCTLAVFISSAEKNL